MIPSPVGPEAAELLAALHAQSFAAPWPATEFAALLGQPGVTALATGDGFILLRSVADEAEILTLAVRPVSRGVGRGRGLVEAGAAASKAAGAQRLFLEVAEDNAAARALYVRAGFVEAGRRRAYYSRASGPPVDALILARSLD